MRRIKTSLATAAVAASAFTMTSAAHAADGVITFSGNLVAAGCDVSVNGSGSSNTVALPSITTDQLDTAGDTAGPTPFTIAISNCNAGLTTVSTYFEPGGTVSTTGNYLANQNGAGATGVHIRLLNASGGVVNLAGAHTAQNAGTATVTGGAAIQRFTAVYYTPAGGATAGALSTSVNYSIIYL